MADSYQKWGLATNIIMCIVLLYLFLRMVWNWNDKPGLFKEGLGRCNFTDNFFRGGY